LCRRSEKWPRDGSSESYGGLSGAHLGDQEGVVAAGEELDHRLDRLALDAEGRAGQLGERDPLAGVGGVVEGRELAGEEVGEGSAVALDQVGGVPGGGVVVVGGDDAGARW
jgi:hypothetical protein